MKWTTLMKKAKSEFSLVASDLLSANAGGKDVEKKILFTSPKS